MGTATNISLAVFLVIGLGLYAVGQKAALEAARVNRSAAEAHAAAMRGFVSGIEGLIGGTAACGKTE